MPEIKEISSNVPVMEAIRKGKRMLLLPRILLTLGLFYFVFLGVIFFKVLGNIAPGTFKHIYEFGLIWIISFIPLIILPYWFWSKRTTKWKLWAFENVKNVHELCKVARQSALFARYGSFLDKVTLQTKSERKQWANLQIKFERADIFEDDAEVPAETIIYFSMVSRLILIVAYLAIGVVALLITISAFRPNLDKWVSIISIGVMGWMAFLIFTMIKSLVERKPQLIISDKGIETIRDGFQSWEFIFNEHFTQGSRRDMGSILRYNYAGGKARIDIGHYKISYEKLDHLLRTYRGRYNSRKRNKY